MRAREYEQVVINPLVAKRHRDEAILLYRKKIAESNKSIGRKKQKQLEYPKKQYNKFIQEHSSTVIDESNAHLYCFRDDDERDLWMGRKTPARLLSLDIGRIPANVAKKMKYAIPRGSIHVCLSKVQGRERPRRTCYLELWRPSLTLRRQISIPDLKLLIDEVETLGIIRRGYKFDPETREPVERRSRITKVNQDFWDFYKAKNDF